MKQKPTSTAKHFQSQESVLYYDQVDDQLENNRMHSVSVAEAKAKFSEILSKVEDGDDVMITRRGRPIARLAGLRKHLKSVKPLANFRSGLPSAKTSATKTVRRMRDEDY